MKHEYSKAAIGRRLKLTRQALGLKQNKLCRLAKINAQSYNQYEKGKKQPRLDTALTLCEAFGMTLDWIYRGELSGVDPALRIKLLEQQVDRC